MDNLENLIRFVYETLLQEIIVVVAGVLFAQFIQNRWEAWRYGNWKVVIHQGGKDVLKRPVSPGKVKDGLAVPEDLAVFLKGVASPYGWINCDLLTDGKDLGLFVLDRQNREFVINMDKNPQKSVDGSERG